MPKITFLPENVTFEVSAGTTILEAAELNGYPLPSSCRMGRCITDLVRVVSGMENLSLPDPDEADTLSIVDEPNGRLACVTRILKGEVVVERLNDG